MTVTDGGGLVMLVRVKLKGQTMISKSTMTCFAALMMGATALTGCATISDQAGNVEARHLLDDDTLNPRKVEKTIIAMAQDDSDDTFDGSEIGLIARKIDISNDGGKRKRNEIQDYLKAISNQNCAQFKGASLSTQSNINFGLGVAATALATTGALLKPASTAQALAGTSAAVTGVKSQVSENYYREKAFEVITRAINVRRKALWEDVKIRRLDDANPKKGIPYTVNNAIADAIDYNNACSLIEGFEELNDSVSAKDRKIEEAVKESSDATGTGTSQPHSISGSEKDYTPSRSITGIAATE